METNEITTREKLKTYFETGKYPTESQFAEWIDSYWHKEDITSQETLGTVVSRDNQIPEQGIKFVQSKSTPSTKIELRVNKTTWSQWFGNMNPDHTGIYNSSFGFGALQNVTTGDGNVAFGSHALWQLTTGIRNTVVGSSSMIALKEGYWNVVVGQAALYYFATGHNNTAVGRVAMCNFIGGYGNTALGSHSGFVDGGAMHTQEYNFNTFLGFRSGYTTDLPNNLKGNNNVTIGANAPIGGNTSNKLVIHSSETVLNHNVTLPLIGGDFVKRTLDFDSSLKVHRLPKADSGFTQNVVAKSDGTFGVEEKTNGNYYFKEIFTGNYFQIDNEYRKPLYRCVIMENISEAEIEKTIELSSLNIDHIFVSGTARKGSYSYHIANAENLSVHFIHDDAYLNFRQMNGQEASWSLHIILEYTKASDIPLAI
ncbi:hypothetical protein [Chryseobacterium takakiae]|uniref:Uncharacterized protein n=1 Tax=Chryseobacterium takakiae TaxID=1302685 RepID=A0A1M4WDH1_9FLAO|nr:hypothetical protein [Chryseobacterium takakiae]SHE79113.1 hypothetical protein SAMN05444408_104125 [Chryseobacterium takakiae]